VSMCINTMIGYVAYDENNKFSSTKTTEIRKQSVYYHLKYTKCFLSCLKILSVEIFAKEL